MDETGHPKVLDFGVARVTDSDAQATRQTDFGQLVGTLAYMSPEQALADPLALDTRSDVYALGVILYELLAGKLPYQLSRTLHEAVLTIRNSEPAPLSSIQRNFRGDIETITAKALEKDKERRYASAADLAEIWPAPGESADHGAAAKRELPVSEVLPTTQGRGDRYRGGAGAGGFVGNGDLSRDNGSDGIGTFSRAAFPIHRGNRRGDGEDYAGCRGSGVAHSRQLQDQVRDYSREGCLKRGRPTAPKQRGIHLRPPTFCKARLQRKAAISSYMFG